MPERGAQGNWRIEDLAGRADEITGSLPGGKAEADAVGHEGGRREERGDNIASLVIGVKGADFEGQAGARVERQADAIGNGSQAGRSVRGVGAVNGVPHLRIGRYVGNRKERRIAAYDHRIGGLELEPRRDHVAALPFGGEANGLDRHIPLGLHNRGRHLVEIHAIEVGWRGPPGAGVRIGNTGARRTNGEMGLGAGGVPAGARRDGGDLRRAAGLGGWARDGDLLLRLPPASGEGRREAFRLSLTPRPDTLASSSLARACCKRGVLLIGS